MWWHLQQLFEHGLLVRRPQGHPVLPALRHGAVEPRTGSARGLHRRGRRERLRASRDHRRRRPRDRAARRTWRCGRRRRGRCSPTSRSPSTPRSPTRSSTAPSSRPNSSSRSSVTASTPSATFPGSALAGVHYQRPFTDAKLPEDVDACYVVLADYVTIEEGTGLVHQAPAFGEIDRQVARDHGLPTLNPVGPDGKFTAEIPWLEGQDVRDANHVDQRRARATRHADPPTGLQPLAAALLALRDGAHLLGQAELVRRDEQVPREAAGRERDDRLAPRAHPRRSLRQLAGQQRRLGAVARPLLGDAAADLALSRRPLHVRRLARRALGARRTRPRRPRSASPGDRRGRRAVSHVRQRGPSRRAGHRRVVRRRVHARGPGRLSPRRGQRRGDAVPGPTHRRGDRPDARLVLHARSRSTPWSSAPSRTSTCCASVTSSTRTARR